MNIRERSWNSAEVAAAAGMSHANFRQLLTRKQWSIGDKAQPASASGKGHAFSIYDALGYALAWRLYRMGAPATLAYELGVLDGAYSGLIEPLLGQQGDQACWFAYFPWQPRREASQVLTGPRSLVASFFADFTAGEAVVIDLFGLRNQVFASLGIEI